MIRNLLWIVAMSACAPASAPPASPDQTKPTTMPTTKQPTPQLTFVQGPPIRPASRLLEWLNGALQASPSPDRWLQIPVVIRYQDEHRIAIGDAFIGDSDAAPDSDAIFLSLNDTRMGISLLSRLRQRCPDATTACVVWLEGQWGNRGPGPLSSPHTDLPRRWPFVVRAVHDRVEAPRANEDTFIRVEPPVP